MLSRNAGWREVRSARQAWPTAARQTGAAVPPQVRAEPDRERSSKAQPTGRAPTAITSTEITRDAACAGGEQIATPRRAARRTRRGWSGRWALAHAAWHRLGLQPPPGLSPGDQCRTGQHGYAGRLRSSVTRREG